MIRLSEETTQEELLEYVNTLNHDASVHGILVQLPLPKHIDTDAVLEAIVPEKRCGRVPSSELREVTTKG